MSADSPGISTELDRLWAHHHGEWRDTAQVVAQWQTPSMPDARLLKGSAKGHWWDILGEIGTTLVATREYEHIIVAFDGRKSKKRISYLPLPHPNGLALDSKRGLLYVASTRNPNLIFEFSPQTTFHNRTGHSNPERLRGVLMPRRCRYLPGCLYIHDIAIIAEKLYANAVSMNAVVELFPDGGFKPVWWPQSIETPRGPMFEQNYLQLNSIAGGATLKDSFFSASAAAPSRRRPGHLNFPIDRKGVIFSGRTREVCGTGLTRPHSARLLGKELWVDNSGYGEVGRIKSGVFEPLVKLPGWTRGLAVHGNYLFAGTSRVIPRFRHYAPGLDCDKSVSGLHVLDRTSGRVLGSFLWPNGNQIFAVELLHGMDTPGFPLEWNGKGSGNAELVTKFFFMAS